MKTLGTQYVPTMDTKFQMKHIQIICRYLEALVIYLPYCVVDKPKQSSSPPLDPMNKIGTRQDYLVMSKPWASYENVMTK